jgi:hypothetical protein
LEGGSHFICCHSVKLEYNGFKLELKGERGFIDEKIGDMGALLEKILSTPPSYNALEDKNDMLISDTSEPIASGKIGSESIREFLNRKNFATNIDTTLGVGYYIEMQCGLEDFSKIEIEEYMRKAKYQVPNNVSLSIFQNAEKGYFQESINETKPKRYCLTDTGIKYVESFTGNETKEKAKGPKAKRSRGKIPSSYESLTREGLNLDKYPRIIDLSSFKDKMIVSMYIISSQGKGEYFSVNDILFIMLNIFGEKATIDQITGVLTREPTWFNKDTSTRPNKFKLLSRAEDQAQKIIKESSSTS